MQDIAPPGENVVGKAINDHGYAAGNLPSTGQVDWFIYGGGMFQDLGNFGVLESLNNSEIVGSDYVFGQTKTYAKRLTLNLTVLLDNQDLNGVIDPAANVYLADATGINYLGQICCFGTNASGIQVGFILTPVK
jgi:hypothetical protein